MSLWIDLKVWLTDKLVGKCCCDCLHYELCYYEHPEKYERNTIESPACKKFKEVV